MAEPTILEVEVSEEAISAELSDGGRISVPLAWSWRLSEASPIERGNYRLIGDGTGVRWPDVDEDISVHGMLYGSPARPPKQMA